MLILDFLLAFAILMVAFSTIVSGLVEVLTRLLNLRSRNLRSSLDGYLESVLWPTLLAADGDAPPKRATLAGLRDHLTRNMAVPEGLSRRSGPVEMLSKLGSKPWIESLSPEALVQRLAETDLGQRLRETVFETGARPLRCADAGVRPLHGPVVREVPAQQQLAGLPRLADLRLRGRRFIF